MLLKCPICSHEWQEDEVSGAVVICPECVGYVPVATCQVQSAATSATGEEKTRAVSKPSGTGQTPTKTPGSGDDKTRMVSRSSKAGDKRPGSAAADPTSPTMNIPAAGRPSGDQARDPKYHDGDTVIDPPKTSSAPASPESSLHSAPTHITAMPDATAETMPPPTKKPLPAKLPPNKDSGRREPLSRDQLHAQYNKLIGKSLDGYRIEKLLGAGGMGAVYLAHQVSLDRKVAIKILPAHLAKSFDLVARFTREALSAAQLNHHNVVQVYDVGTADGIHYIVMEFVRGESLGQVIRKDGPLRVDDAAGYVLQAARGLHHAHEHGIIHRDIKPDNLMVNEHGIVKIADMGLAKMRGVVEESAKRDEDSLHSANTNLDLTLANMALGTPAYMAPEQAKDTANVDSRADQYSLGCTLYYLCAGKAPYSGTTAFELMSKHLKEPLIPIETHVRGVPPAFSELIKRMLAKKPEDRYPSLKEASKALESYLGIDSDQGPYRPREHHLAILEDAQSAYYAAPSAKRRKLAVAAFFVLLPLLIIAAFISRNFVMIGAAFAVGVLVPLSSIVIDGIANKTYLYRRLRGAVFGMSWKSWLQTTLASAGIISFLVLTGWIYSWLAVLVFAVALAFAYQMMVLRPLRKQRQVHVDVMQEMLKELRIRGLSEEALRDFICNFSGADWQEFFEEFFSYESMLEARAHSARADQVKARRKFATWRDPLLRWVDRVDETRSERKRKETLTRAEADRLKEQGISEEEARRQADEEATRILDSISVKTPGPEPKVRKKRLRLGGPLNLLYRLGRAALGIFILVAALLPLLAGFGIALPVPSFLTSILSENAYYSWGWGQSLFGLIAGLAVLLSAFSRRVIMPALVVCGALILVVANPIIQTVNQPQLNVSTIFFAGAGLIVIGLGYSILAKLSGGKF